MINSSRTHPDGFITLTLLIWGTRDMLRWFLPLGLGVEILSRLSSATPLS